MRVFTAITALLTVVLAPACTRGNGQGKDRPVEMEQNVGSEVSGEEKKVANSVNQSGFRMLTELAKEEGKNVFFSPTSISTALAMTWNGAGGETASEMAAALQFAKMEKESVNRGFREMIEGLQHGDPKAAVSLANAVWVKQGGAFHPDFLRSVQEFFKAEASQLNFADSAGAAERINSWVKEKTREKITSILQPADLGPLTDAVLTNAIYFRGLWTTPFDSKNTSPGKFTLADGSAKTLPMMRVDRLRARFLTTQEFQAAALPYGSGRFQFYVFVPATNLGLKGFLPSVTSEKWAEWMAGFREDHKTVTLPRFKVEMEKSLVKPLQEMGMKRAFGDADLTPMGFPDASISEVKHKAVMEVNEEGTTAAAATAVVVTRSAISTPFTVDRPFFAAISDRRTGALLFLGAVYDPEAL